MFRDAKVGDRVWSFKYGWGVVKKIHTASREYPLEIEFKNEISISYSLVGKYNFSNLLPDLYWDEIKFEIPKKPAEKKKYYLWAVSVYSFEVEYILKEFLDDNGCFTDGAKHPDWDSFQTKEKLEHIFIER